MRRIQISLVFVIGLALVFASTAHAQENVLVIVADNVSPELIEAYGEGSDPAPTPTLDALAASGVLFRNATSNPFGGPTRATLLTGRYGFRTNVGARKPPTQAPAWTKLDAEEVTIPEMLEAYRSAALGEWNIGPLPQGFEYYAGAPDDLDWNYLNFTKRRHFPDGTWDDVRVTCDENNTDPVVANHSAGRSKPCYETTNIVDEAILKIGEFETAGDPWLVWVAFHAARAPFHMPPDDLLPSDIVYDPIDSDKQRAMVEAMDTEIGRLMTHVPADTTVVFVSDNAGEEDSCSGTPALGSCIRVPLIVRRPGSSAGEVSDALVNTTDLFATVAEIAGATSTAEDSVSLLPYLVTPAAPTQHRPSAGGPYAYAEYFHFGVGAFGRAIRDARYKYVWDYSGASGPSEALYDLDADPGELSNLLLDCSGTECVPTPPQAGAERAAYRALTVALFKTLHDSDWDEIPYQEDNCLDVHQLANTCDTDGDGIGNACDCDFNYDGACDASDESTLTGQLDLPTPSNFDPDMNCDGTVDASDQDLFLAMCDTDDDGICDTGRTPGSSGLYCADALSTSGTCGAPVIPDSGVTVPENILLIVLDDVPRNWVGTSATWPESEPVRRIAPNIDTIAESGVRFSTVWGNSSCSPTRATILTGMYALRNNVGAPSGGLPLLEEATLPQILSPAYRTAAVGKVHSISNGDLVQQGFESYVGANGNLGGQWSYYWWIRSTVDASGLSCETIGCTVSSQNPRDPNWDGYKNCYATSVTISDAIAKIEEFEATGDPWFIWLGTHAVHTFYHVPPYALLSEETQVDFETEFSEENPSKTEDPTRTVRRAMLEALDTEIGRLLCLTDPLGPHCPFPENTTIVIVGDNGPDEKKLKITEGGVRVPLIIKRPGMPAPGSVSAGLVNTTDLFATLTEIAGIPTSAADSESLIPLVENPELATQHRGSTGGPYVYTEIFDATRDERAIRSDQYKYVWELSGAEALYDLETDPQQQTNRLDLNGDGVPNPPQPGAEQDAYDALTVALAQVQDADDDGVDYRYDNCTEVWNGIDPHGGKDLSCDTDGDTIGNACDCDFNNDDQCDEDDLGILLANDKFKGLHVADMNCDGKVSGPDEDLFLPMQGGKPGPSGFAFTAPGSMTCGNEQREIWEECDFTQRDPDVVDFGSLSCADYGWTGELTCSNCWAWESSCIGYPDCWNGVLDIGEACEGVDFAGLTCLDFGCQGGDLGCYLCESIDKSLCTGCCDNDGTCAPNEDCASCPGDCSC